VLSRFLVAIAGATAIAALVTQAPIGSAQPAPVQPQPGQGISVVGQGIVITQPNVARITIGADVTDPSLANAQAEAARRMDAVINQLKASGIADNDIRTVNYSINPIYDQPNQGQQPTLRGYQVQNQVEVRVTNVAGLGALLDTAVSAGATRVMGIRFEASNMEDLKNQARDQAMQNARAKADQLARDAGVTVGRPISLDESDTGGVTPVRAAAPAAALSAAPQTPIQPGDLQVSTTVRVVWAIQ
jgi:uncharacterized protein YggE